MKSSKISIDELIVQKRTEMRANGDSMNISEIYDQIHMLAQKISLERPIPTVNIHSFYNLDDVEFVRALYNNILGREPEAEGLYHWIEILSYEKLDKVEIISAFISSEEAKKRQINVIGLNYYRRKNAVSLFVKKIPIIRRFYGWAKNMVFLSCRIHYLQYCDNMAKLSLHNMEMDEVERYTNLQEIINQYKDRMNEHIKIVEEERIRQEEEERIRQEEQKQFLDKIYLRYNEIVMPDSREQVKQGAQVYIDKIRHWHTNIFEGENEPKIVDLGCGECEWLELLTENGFHAIGVDGNSAVVQKVREQFPEIEIVEADAIQYLQNCEDQSVDMLSSFHMIEHMDFGVIMLLLKECYRVMKPKGLLIIETPNPQNILTATYYFHMDPTHIKPIPPELMEFFLKECGFSVYQKILLKPLEFIPYTYEEEDPIKDIVFRFNMEQAYAYMVVKE